MTATFLAGGSSETSVPWPVDHLAGDDGLLLVEHGGGTIATPTDCTPVDGFPLNQGGGSLLSAFTIHATSAAMPNLALSGGSNHMIGVLIRIRGGDTANLIAEFAAMKQSGTTTNGAAPAVTTHEDDLAILNIIAWAGDLAGPISGTEANSSLTSVGEVFDGGTTSGDGGGIIVLSGVKATKGPVGMTTCTLSSATAFSGVTLAIRPAPAYVLADTVTINGVAAPDGGTVRAFDVNDAKATQVLANGDGTFSLDVPSNAANRYVVVFNNGASYGASPDTTAV